MHPFLAIPITGVLNSESSDDWSGENRRSRLGLPKTTSICRKAPELTAVWYFDYLHEFWNALSR